MERHKSIRIIIILMLVSLSPLVFGQDATQGKAKRPRPGDKFNRQQVEYTEFGHSDKEKATVWDISQLKTMDSKHKSSCYPPRIKKKGEELYIMGRDTFRVKETQEDELLIVREHGTSYYYHIRDNIHYLTGYENPTSRMHYTEPLPVMVYPVTPGWKAGHNYSAECIYSSTVTMSLHGTYRIEADAAGKMVLPSGDILQDVVRVRSEQTILSDPVESMDSISVDTRIEKCQWYAPDSPYPVYETVKTVHRKDKTEDTFTAAFYFSPEDQEGATREDIRKDLALEDFAIGYYGNQRTSMGTGYFYGEWENTYGDLYYYDAFTENNRSSSASPGFSYNANGAMTQDEYKGFTMGYNTLGMPLQVIVPAILGTINYKYSATGEKLEASYAWHSGLSLNPVENIGKPQYTAPNSSLTRQYIGNKVYENGTLKRILFGNGYYSNGNYYFYLRDHVGNNCVVVNANGSTQQGTYYHPFGKSIENCESYNRSFQPYKYGGKEEEQMHGMGLYDFGARQLDEMVPGFLTVDPLCEKYYSVSPYVYCLNNPVKFVDPDGRVVRLANNYAGGMENIAKIAATSLGSQVMSHLIGRNETYTLNSTFWTSSSSYDPRNGNINYVGSPWHSEIPFDGGALNSMIAMGHETFHAFDNSNYIFNAKNAAYSRDIVEPRAVSFGNYLRQSYSLSPLREGYGNIQGNFHQFPSNEKISDFTTLGNSSDKTSYGFSYTKTTTIVESYKKGFLGMKIPDKTRTETTMHYMTVSRDKNNNASFQIYDNEEAYKKATSNW